MSDPLVDVIRQLRTEVDAREWRVFVLRYGLDGYDPRSDGTLQKGRVRKRSSKDRTIRTLEEVGDEMDVTRERIRQIEARALRRLQHPSRRRVVKAAISQQLDQVKGGQLEFDHAVLVGVLNGYREEFPTPDRWIAFLSHLFPDMIELASPELLLKDPKKLLREQLELNGGSIDATEFAGMLAETSVTAEDINKIMVGLYQADLGYVWIDGMILVPRNKEIARYVLRRAGKSLHWSEIYERASELELGRELGKSTFYNAIQTDHSVFAYQRQGTYGLREWGLSRKRFQKDVLVDWFRREQRNAVARDIAASLEGTEEEIKLSSIGLYLGTNPLFFEDIDGKYGLREWLPAPEDQRLDTPRRLRESKRSRERHSGDIAEED